MTWKRCMVCSHPAREGIEKKIREGMSLELLGQRFGISDDNLRRHRDNDMLAPNTGILVETAPAVATKEAQVMHARMDPAALFEEHNDCIRECHELIAWSKRNEDPKGWALGVREWRGCLDQKNKMLGLYDQVDPRLQTAFAQRIIDVVSRALEKFPDARVAVLTAIDEVEKDV